MLSSGINYKLITTCGTLLSSRISACMTYKYKFLVYLIGPNHLYDYGNNFGHNIVHMVNGECNKDNRKDVVND